MEAHGGQYRVRRGEAIVKFGKWAPRRLVVIKFPSWDDLGQLETSPEYGQVAQIRQGPSTIVFSISVEGYEGYIDSLQLGSHTK